MNLNSYQRALLLFTKDERIKVERNIEIWSLTPSGQWIVPNIKKENSLDSELLKQILNHFLKDLSHYSSELARNFEYNLASVIVGTFISPAYLA